MAVDDVYPRRNLPGTAEDWGRALETDVVGTKKALEIVGQNIGAQNRATAASLQELSRQLAAISQAQTEIEAAQSGILATQNFLLNQTQYGEKTGGSGGVRGATGGITLEAYDSGQDVSLSVTTSSTGILAVTVSSLLVSFGSTAGCGVEVVGVSSPDLFKSVSVRDATLSASRQSLLTLSPNTTYTIRSRRWYDGPGGTVAYSYSGLTVTKVGQ